MSQELQLGKYEFFPYDEEIQRLLDELLLTDEEREKRYQMIKKEAERFIKHHKRLKRIDKKFEAIAMACCIWAETPRLRC